MTKDINALLPEYTDEEKRLLIEYRKANNETKWCIQRILHIDRPETRPKVIYAAAAFGNNKK